MNRLNLLLIILVLGCNQAKERKFLVTKIRSAAKLATSEVTLTKIVCGDLEQKGPKGWFNYTNPSVIFRTEAKVKFGIDLKKIRNEDVHLDGDSIHLTLPDVEILNFSYPHEKFEEIFSDYDRNKNKEKVELLDKYFRLAEIDIRRKVKLMNLEKRTEEKTIQFLENFLSQYDFERIVIQFKREVKK